MLGCRLMASAEQAVLAPSVGALSVFVRAEKSRYPIGEPRTGVASDSCPIKAVERTGLSENIFPTAQSGWLGLSRQIFEPCIASACPFRHDLDARRPP
jgi:hypothetical protein